MGGDVGPLTVEQILAEEAAAIHQGDGKRQQLKSSISEHVAGQNQDFEDNRANKDADIRTGADEDPAWAEQRKSFYCDLNNIGRAALCCSGGGIRSATFCLGVIQALAMIAQPKSQIGNSSGTGTPE
jgi:hypothetical protein